MGIRNSTLTVPTIYKEPISVLSSCLCRQNRFETVICNFRATNNEAGYEALIAGLILADELRARNLEAFSDSQLIVNLIQRDYQAKDSSMSRYLSVTK